MINKTLRYSAIFGTLMIIICACANMNSSLIGGAKDVTPPKLVSSMPVMAATNFKGNKIQLNFDEFIKLSEVNKQLVISPPLKKRPSVMQRNKSIYITIDETDTFKANSTYTFYFGNAIQDLNESNILKNFEFVFSTGSIIDSLSLRGTVLSAFDHSAEKEGYFVMLYNKFEDSIPRKTLPNYVTKTDAKGYFTLTHMKADSFMIFALKDGNQNLLYDLPNELIGFSDTTIHLNENYFVPKDTALRDTAKFDSLRLVLPNLKPQIELFTFEEDHNKQFLSKFERPQPYRFTLNFNRKPYDSIAVKPLNFKAENWILPDKNKISDTIMYWITDTAIVHKDTLRTVVTFSKLDSLGKMVLSHDTISLTNKKRIGSRPSVKKGDSKKKANEFVISSPFDRQEGFDLNKRFYISASFPLLSTDTSKINLYKIDDTKEKGKIPIKFKISPDTLFLRNFWIDFKSEPNTSYLLIADSSAFTSIYRQISDSTGIGFKTQKDDYYGSLKFNLSNVTQPVIIQLVGDRDVVLYEKYANSDGPLLFNFLPPGKFRVKVIYDRNGNKKWDTGNFKKRIQPERVDYYKGILTIRSNWDIIENWKLK